MGYISRLRGKIDIHPSLTWSETLATGFDPDSAYTNDSCVMIAVESCTEEIDRGTFIVKYPVLTGYAIVPRFDEGKAYTLLADMETLCKHPVFNVRTLSGYIYCYGERAGDVSRIDGTGRAETARMFWADGTEAGEQ